MTIYLKEPKGKMITVRLSDVDHEALSALASIESVGVSTKIRQAIKTYLKAEALRKVKSRK